MIERIGQPKEIADIVSLWLVRQVAECTDHSSKWWPCLSSESFDILMVHFEHDVV